MHWFNPTAVPHFVLRICLIVLLANRKGHVVVQQAPESSGGYLATAKPYDEGQIDREGEAHGPKSGGVNRFE